MPSHDLARVERIAPVDGWALYQGEYWSPDERPVPFFYAVRGAEERLLNTSSYFFTPTQERFAWIVRHDFPTGMMGPGGALCPLDNDTIDCSVLTEALAASRNSARDVVRRVEGRFTNVAAALVVLAGCAWVGLVARVVL